MKCRDRFTKRKIEDFQTNYLDEDGEPDKGLTEQHHKDECDVINILNKYDSQGILTHVNKARGMYGDFTELNEYRESLDLIKAADTAFSSLPSKIRQWCGNDAGQVMEFVSNPANREEAITLGMTEPPASVSKEPPKTEVTKVKEKVDEKA